MSFLLTALLCSLKYSFTYWVTKEERGRGREGGGWVEWIGGGTRTRKTGGGKKEKTKAEKDMKVEIEIEKRSSRLNVIKTLYVLVWNPLLYTI